MEWLARKGISCQQQWQESVRAARRWNGRRGRDRTWELQHRYITRCEEPPGRGEGWLRQDLGWAFVFALQEPSWYVQCQDVQGVVTGGGVENTEASERSSLKSPPGAVPLVPFCGLWGETLDIVGSKPGDWKSRGRQMGEEFPSVCCSAVKTGLGWR